MGQMLCPKLSRTPKEKIMDCRYPQSTRFSLTNLAILAFSFLLAGLTSFVSRPARAQTRAQTAPHLKEHQFRERTSSAGETLETRSVCAAESAAGPQIPIGRLPAWQLRECITHERIPKESGLQWWHEYDRDVQLEPTFLVAPAGGTRGWTGAARRRYRAPV
jgi:hypothetical protein